jgi:iron complex outermembrane receptor protein
MSVRRLIDVSVGDYEQYDASLVFSTPIIEDKLSLLLGLRHYNRGSMYRADDGGDLGEEESNSLSGVLYWEPTDRLQVKLRGLFLRDSDGPPMGYLIRGQDLDTCTGRTFPGRFADDGSPFTIDFTNGRPGSGAPIDYLCGEPPGIGASVLTTRETNLRPDILSQVFGTVDTVNGGFIPGPNPDLLIEQLIDQKSLPGVPSMDRFGLERINRRLSLSVDYEFSNGWALAVLAGHNDQDLNYLRDFDRTNIQAWYSQDPQTLDDDSFEIRLTSGQDQRLRWLVGAAYYEQEFVTSGGGGFLVTGQLAPLTSGILALPVTSGDEAQVQGIFGALSYDITEQLTLDLEARYEEDERTVAAADGTLATTYDAVTPRVILSWQPNDSTNIYAQYSRGALPGRVNGLIASCDPTPFSTPYPDPLNPGQLITLSECDQFARQGATDSTDTQELNAFELGIKKLLWDGRINLSAAVYSWTWDAKPSSLSVSWVAPGPDGEPNDFPNTLGATIGGDSEIIGMDLEAAVALTENWSASLTVTALETEFTSFSDQGLSQLTGTGNQKGNEEPFVPNVEASFSTTYTDQLTADWDWFGRFDVSYRGEYYADYENLLEGPSFMLANLRGGVSNGDLRLELFVTNLFDEDTWLQVGGAIDFSPQPANFNFLAFQGASLTPQDRRTLGARVSYSF